MKTFKINRAFKALVLDKQPLTAKQIAVRFGVANPRDVVYSLRMEGFPINLVNHRDSKGRQTKKYQFGKPSQKVIAAGYKALAAGLV